VADIQICIEDSAQATTLSLVALKREFTPLYEPGDGLLTNFLSQRLDVVLTEIRVPVRGGNPLPKLV